MDFEKIAKDAVSNQETRISVLEDSVREEIRVIANKNAVRAVELAEVIAKMGRRGMYDPEDAVITCLLAAAVLAKQDHQEFASLTALYPDFGKKEDGYSGDEKVNHYLRIANDLTSSFVKRYNAMIDPTKDIQKQIGKALKRAVAEKRKPKGEPETKK